MLKNIKNPSQIKKMSIPQLEALASEIRQDLIRVVSENGGHLSSNLGIVELTLAMHYVFDCPEDKFVFDVGHQAYVHKMLTGRYSKFDTLRRKDGLSGFPNPDESKYDTFAAGHASSAISAALGLARTRDIMHAENNIVAVVGDGALTGGMCYEALNDAGQSQTRMIVILNDNEMSISENVGAIKRYLSELRQTKGYRSFKRSIRNLLERIPKIGTPIFKFIEKLRDRLKLLFIDGQFFEALGFAYTGPIDGHDLKHLIRVLQRAKEDNRPVLVHVLTQKGRGYTPAEDHPDDFHGVLPFVIESGKSRTDANEISNGKIAAHHLSEMAQSDIRICVVSAAMASGTGMCEFAKAHPDRFFDVGIAEEHAVTMAAGMAAGGLKPYVVIYSTFLQRGYDQIMIDVCRNNLPVTFLLDRAGFVGADGSTHQGLYDISYLRSIPNLVVASPRDVRDLKRLLDLSQEINRPMAIRYSKSGMDLGPGIASQRPLECGKWELLSDAEDVMIYSCGAMVQIAMQAVIELMGKGIRAGVTDARFIKPMDNELLCQTAGKVKLVVTLEENTRCGGLGEAIASALVSCGMHVNMLQLYAPDRFISHASIDQQRAECKLDVLSICSQIEEVMKKNG